MVVNVAHTLPRSRVNGPGERFVLWVQGCSIACPGCWNPDTWSFKARKRMTVSELHGKILSTQGIEGVTYSGGEPFDQAGALADLAHRVRASGLSLFIFTGYNLDELNSPCQKTLLDFADIVVAGPYMRSRRTTELPWCGSSNQQVHFLSDRYSRSDLPTQPESEVHILPDGSLRVTGFPER
jgi:anaerobic ribonucleoside-triphosphate reductase activating protein